MKLLRSELASERSQAPSNIVLSRRIQFSGFRKLDVPLDGILRADRPHSSAGLFPMVQDLSQRVQASQLGPRNLDPVPFFCAHCRLTVFPAFGLEPLDELLRLAFAGELLRLTLS